MDTEYNIYIYIWRDAITSDGAHLFISLLHLGSPSLCKFSPSGGEGIPVLILTRSLGEARRRFVLVRAGVYLFLAGGGFLFLRHTPGQTKHIRSESPTFAAPASRRVVVIGRERQSNKRHRRIPSSANLLYLPPSPPCRLSSPL